MSKKARRNSIFAIFIIIVPIFLIGNVIDFYSGKYIETNITNKLETLDTNNNNYIYNNIYRIGNSNNYYMSQKYGKTYNVGSINYISDWDRQDIYYEYNTIIFYKTQHINNNSNLNLTVDYYLTGSHTYTSFNKIYVELFLMFDKYDTANISTYTWDYIVETQAILQENNTYSFSFDISNLFIIIESVGYEYFGFYIYGICPNERYNGEIFLNFDINSLAYTEIQKDMLYIIMFSVGIVYIGCGIRMFPKIKQKVNK